LGDGRGFEDSTLILGRILNNRWRDDQCGCDGARSSAGDFADASLDTSGIAFVLDCHVWSNDKLRVTARNVSLLTVDLPVAALHVQVVKRRVDERLAWNACCNHEMMADTGRSEEAA
jgi:hypothetical protein